MDLGGIFEMETETHVYNIVFKGYPDVLTVQEVCEILRVSDKVVYRILHKNPKLFFNAGRAFRIPKKKLMEHLELFDSPKYEQPTA